MDMVIRNKEIKKMTLPIGCLNQGICSCYNKKTCHDKEFINICNTPKSKPSVCLNKIRGLNCIDCIEVKKIGVVDTNEKNQ